MTNIQIYFSAVSSSSAHLHDPQQVTNPTDECDQNSTEETNDQDSLFRHDNGTVPLSSDNSMTYNSEYSGSLNVESR